MATRLPLDQIPSRPTKAFPTPPVQTRLQVLPLHELEWENFERLCVRIAREDPDADHAQSYGVPGQAQFGIDLHVRRKSRPSFIVWQCKCYQDFSAKQIADAVQKFLDDAPLADPGSPVLTVDTLVLAVTVDVRQTQLANEIEKQTTILQAKGIRFRVLGLNELSDELKKYRNLIEEFFHPAWTDVICGPAQSTSLAYASPLVGQMALSVLGPLVSKLVAQASQIERDIEEARRLWAEGKEADALTLVVALQGRAEWETVPPSIQARALRVEGSLQLQKGELNRAKELLAEAKRIDPTGVHRILEAKIAREEKDIDAALAILGDTSDPNEIPLRWNFLLECGRTAEVITEAAQKLSGKTPEGDTACTFALALVAERRPDEARTVVETARSASPKHRSLQYVAAIADYMSTLSPAFSAWRHLTWPVPVPEYFFKRDAESVRRRQTAAETFARLRASATGEERDRFLTWEIAACASDRASLARAEDLCRNGLHENPATVPLIVWATTLAVQFDRPATVSALETKINASGATLDDVLALIGVLDDAKEGPKIEGLLDRQKHLFDEREQTFLYYFHKAQVLAIRGERDAALKGKAERDRRRQRNLRPIGRVW